MCAKHGVNYTGYDNIFANLASTTSYISQVGAGVYRRNVKAKAA